jgi:hypothetical protein
MPIGLGYKAQRFQRSQQRNKPVLCDARCPRQRCHGIGAGGNMGNEVELKGGKQSFGGHETISDRRDLTHFVPSLRSSAVT